DDVDSLPAKLANDRLHAGSFHSDARAHRVDVAFRGDDCDLGAVAGFTNSRPDLDGAVVDFRHFHFEQALEQFRRRSGDFDLRARGVLRHGVDHHADALALAESFGAGLLGPGQDCFDFSEIDDDPASLKALNEAVHELPDSVDILEIDVIALGFADLLKN